MRRPVTPGIVLLVWGLVCGVAAVVLAVPTSLPISTLPGGGGVTWQSIANFTVGGVNRLGISDAFLAGPPVQGDAFDVAMTILVDGVGFVAPATVDLTGTPVTGMTVTAGPVTLSGLNVTMQYFADPALPVLRTFVRLTNPTGAVITATVTLETNNGSDSATQIITSSDGDTIFTTADRWVITDDDNFLTPTGDPTNTHVLFGPGAPPVVPSAISTTVFDAAGREGIRADYPLVVLPGGTVSLLFFNQLSPTSDAAITSVALFDTPTALGPAGLLDGLTSADLASVVNWDLSFVTGFAQPGDLDGDGDLDTADAQLLLEILVGLVPPTFLFTAAGDVNADEVINNLDSLLILAISSGRIPPLPDISLTMLTHNSGAGTITITGSPGAVPGGSRVRLRNDTTGAPPVVRTAATDGSFSITLVATEGDRLIIDVDNSPARFSGTVSADPPPFFSGIIATPDPAQANDVLTITFTASEPLQTNPVVTVGGPGNVATFGSVNPQTLFFTYTYTVLGTEGEGPVGIDISGADRAGNQGNGTGVVMITGAPLATITFPGPASVLTYTPVTVRGTAQDASQITSVEVNGIVASTADGFATWSVVVPLSPGLQNLTVRTVDVLGNSNPTAATASVNIFAPPLLAGPAGIATDASGNVVVTDPFLNAVLEIPLTGSPRVIASGAPFGMPAGVAFDATGNLLVTDRFPPALWSVDRVTGNRTLVSSPGACFSLGAPLGLVAESSISAVVVNRPNTPTAPGEVLRVDLATGSCTLITDCTADFIPLDAPTGIVRDPLSGNLFVVDQERSQVIEVNSVGACQVFSGLGFGTGPLFAEPFGITLDASSGNLLVTDFFLAAVFSVDSSGNRTLLSAPGLGSGIEFGTPAGIALRLSNPVVADIARAAVLEVLASGDRTPLLAGGLTDGTPPLLLEPLGLTVDPTGKIFVTDTAAPAVVNIDLTSTNSRTVIADASTCPLLQQPVGIIPDTNGLFLVTDTTANMVLQINANGSCIPVANPTTCPALQEPISLAREVPSGDLLVGIFDSDLGPVVLRVNPGNGSCTPIVDTSTCPPLQEIAGMILDANGDLLVADEGAAAVLRIDPGDGSCTVLVNASSCTPVPLQEPVGLVLDANGMLLVSDEGSAAILQINPGNGSCTALPNGMGLPFGTLGGIGVDPSGNPLVIDTLRSEVVRVDRTSGDRAIISK